jgi:hypothetical protein
VIDPYSGKKAIRINPKLTEDSLQKAVEKTRRFIVDLYVKCENDYVNGIKLYEAIVESKILETTKNQIKTLEADAAKIISDTKKVSAPAKPKQMISQPPVVVVAAGQVDAPIIPPIVTPIPPIVTPIPPIVTPIPPIVTPLPPVTPIPPIVTPLPPVTPIPPIVTPIPPVPVVVA